MTQALEVHQIISGSYSENDLEDTNKPTFSESDVFGLVSPEEEVTVMTEVSKDKDINITDASLKEKIIELSKLALQNRTAKDLILDLNDTDKIQYNATAIDEIIDNIVNDVLEIRNSSYIGDDGRELNHKWKATDIKLIEKYVREVINTFVKRRFNIPQITGKLNGSSF